MDTPRKLTPKEIALGREEQRAAYYAGAYQSGFNMTFLTTSPPVAEIPVRSQQLDSPQNVSAGPSTPTPKRKR
jgi:hypothetical protein